jgi:hypothetical protein
LHLLEFANLMAIDLASIGQKDILKKSLHAIQRNQSKTITNSNSKPVIPRYYSPADKQGGIPKIEQRLLLYESQQNCLEIVVGRGLLRSGRGLAPRFYPTLIEVEHRLFPSWNNRPWFTKLAYAAYCLWETELRAYG